LVIIIPLLAWPPVAVAELESLGLITCPTNSILQPKAIFAPRKKSTPILNRNPRHMFNITCKINGQEIDTNDPKAINKMILADIISRASGDIKAKLTEDEQKKITINVIGDSLDDLSLNVSGPDEVIAKLKAAS
jgi:hypothetical protein